jgi:hypothetical protein
MYNRTFIENSRVLQWWPETQEQCNKLIISVDVYKKSNNRCQGRAEQWLGTIFEPKNTQRVVRSSKRHIRGRFNEAWLPSTDWSRWRATLYT